MQPSCSVDWSPSADEQALLLDLARRSIAHGVEHGRALDVDPERHPEHIRVRRACFVTLEREGLLRGCVGSLHARGPLVVEVARSAFLAAFEDPRFAPVERDELSLLDVHISVLSEATDMQFDGEEDLLAQLRPGVDGLILSDHRGHVGTFLPQVWDKIPERSDFLNQLRRKAGLPADYWSETLRVQRYVTCSFP